MSQAPTLEEPVIGGEAPPEAPEQAAAEEEQPTPRALTDYTPEELAEQEPIRALTEATAERVRKEEGDRIRREAEENQARASREWVLNGGLLRHLNTQFKEMQDAGEESLSPDRVNRALAAVFPTMAYHDYSEWSGVLKERYSGYEVPAERRQELDAAERSVGMDPLKGVPKALALHLQTFEDAIVARVTKDAEKRAEEKYSKDTAARERLTAEQERGEEKRAAPRPTNARGTTPAGPAFSTLDEVAAAMNTGAISAGDYQRWKREHGF